MQTERYVHNHFEFVPKLLHKSIYFHKCKEELFMQLYHGKKYKHEEKLGGKLN